MNYIFKTIETCFSVILLGSLLLVGYVGFRAANLALPNSVTAADLTFEVEEDQGRPWLYFWEDKTPEVEVVSVKKYGVIAVARIRLGEDRIPLTLVSDLSDGGKWRPAPWSDKVTAGNHYVAIDGYLATEQEVQAARAAGTTNAS